MRIGILGVAAGLCLLGCVKSPIPERPVASTAPALEIVQIDVNRDSRTALLKVGDALRPGDALALTVELDRAAYIVVMHAHGSEAGSPIFPPAGGAPVLTPSGRSRIPADGSFLRLPELKPGDTVCVSASEQPLTLPPSCAGAASAFGGRGEQREEPPPPPPDKTDDQRGKPKVKTLRLPTDVAH